MLVSRYLQSVGRLLWPCAILLIVFIPISIWHEHHWRRTLADYAALRREAGAADYEWPSWGLAHLMGVHPGLVLFASAMLGTVVVVAAAALMMTRAAPEIGLPINPFGWVYLWAMVVAGTAAVVAGVAVAIDLWRSPWSRVGWLLRRATHARPDVRAQLFAQALAVDPGLRAGTSAACATATPPGPPLAAPPTAEPAPPPAPVPDDPTGPR